jgi:quinol monooxygenase YgiN
MISEEYAKDAGTDRTLHSGHRSGEDAMAKLAIVATIKTVPGGRDEYLKHLQAHAERCRASEPGTLQFEILLPHNEAETVLLYEVYESAEAFQAHWNGPSLQQMRKDGGHLQASLTGVRCAIAG